MIRPARPEDMAQVAEIWNQIIRDTAHTFTTQEKTERGLRAYLAERQAAGQAFIVHARGGAVQGFAVYFPFRSGPGYRFTMEHTIHIARAERGMGIGRALMEVMLAHARAAGVHSIWAGVSGENVEGQNFHARLGFDEVARLPEVGFKFGRWMDLVLMQKRL